MLSSVRVGLGYFAITRATPHKLAELERVSITNKHNLQFSIFNSWFRICALTRFAIITH
jgi:hypothetical protein